MRFGLSFTLSIDGEDEFRFFIVGNGAADINDMVDNEEHSRILEDHSEAPEAYVTRQELGNLIQAGLDTLAYDQRVAVIMVDIQGMSYEEIAQVTSVALGTVKSRINRGRAKLRNYLLNHKELLPDKFRPRYDIEQCS